MKVMLLNGSPHAKGNTRLALGRSGPAHLLSAAWAGRDSRTSATARWPGAAPAARVQGWGRCVIDDGVNRFREKLAEADGLIVGTPVYYASPNGSVISFHGPAVLQRPGGDLQHKPAAAVAVARRRVRCAALTC